MGAVNTLNFELIEKEISKNPLTNSNNCYSQYL